jgi:hypothetical protein
MSREEIGVMKLVGAGGNYIRGPFIVSGVIVGLMATLVTSLFFIPVSICDRDVCERSHFSASSYCVIESFFLIDLMADPMFIAFVFKKMNSVYSFESKQCV